MYRVPLGFAAGLGRRSKQRAPTMHVSNSTPRVSKVNGNNGYTVYTNSPKPLQSRYHFVLCRLSPIATFHSELSTSYQQRSSATIMSHPTLSPRRPPDPFSPTYPTLLHIVPTLLPFLLLLLLFELLFHDPCLPTSSQNQSTTSAIPLLPDFMLICASCFAPLHYLLSILLSIHSHLAYCQALLPTLYFSRPLFCYH